VLPEGHLARFLWQVLSDLDFGVLEAHYRSVAGEPGRPAYHPRVLAALWIYGMSQGIGTASGIVEACRTRDDFRWLAGGLCPCDQTLLNLLAYREELTAIWLQVLVAMHKQGHIDLSVIAEDGTKMRANASRRSFHTTAEIEEHLGKLRVRLAKKLEELASTPEPDAKMRAGLRGLQGRVARAERAAAELRARGVRQAGDRETVPQPAASVDPPSQAPTVAKAKERLFVTTDFALQPTGDGLTCPAGETLRFVGRYPTDNRRGTYRLFWRSDCTGCSLKDQCTTARGRRVKIIDAQEEVPAVQEPSREHQAHRDGESQGKADADPDKKISDADVEKEKRAREPQASLTDPEAKLMLATSEKRWQPSFNADLAVTQDGIIVSQFLTKNTTDYHSFAPALKNVLVLGHPENWVGDGHYGTYENLGIAHRDGVVLYAPPAMRTEAAQPQATEASNSHEHLPEHSGDAEATLDCNAGRRFRPRDFRLNAEGSTLTCPAGQELRFIGEYQEGRSNYRLFGRRDCGPCPLKQSCTTDRGRRVKIHAHRESVSIDVADPDGGINMLDLARQLAARMREAGDQMCAIRRQTVEPTNAHLKQHGLERFHVRGLERCASVLTLACLTHNILKWNAREKARALKLPA
jgi:transposase/uncharacterized protein (UPF0179 family)